MLIIDPRQTGSAKTAAFVQIFNPNGHEVKACGIARRCVGWLLLQETKRNEVWINPLGGLLV